MQKSYSQILKTQARLKNEINIKYGKMTENERLLNVKDLKYFEESKPFLSAVIPGIHHISSIGSRPTCRGGRAIINPSFLSPEPNKNLLNNNITTPIIKKTPYYNPITNPIPVSTRNPYIMKEMRAMIREREDSITNKTFA